MTLKDVVDIAVNEKLAAIAAVTPGSPVHEIKLIELEAEVNSLGSLARTRATFVEVEAIPLGLLLNDINRIDALGR